MLLLFSLGRCFVSRTEDVAWDLRVVEVEAKEVGEGSLLRIFKLKFKHVEYHKGFVMVDYYLVFLCNICSFALSTSLSLIMNLLSIINFFINLILRFRTIFLIFFLSWFHRIFFLNWLLRILFLGIWNFLFLNNCSAMIP